MGHVGTQCSAKQPSEHKQNTASLPRGLVKIAKHNDSLVANIILVKKKKKKDIFTIYLKQGNE